MSAPIRAAPAAATPFPSANTPLSQERFDRPAFRALRRAFARAACAALAG